MKLPTFDQLNKSKRTPAIIVKRVDDTHIAIRFRQIGSLKQFNRILGRFRDDFLLSYCEVMDGQPWWFISTTQHNVVEDFARRYGLQMVEE